MSGLGDAFSFIEDRRRPGFAHNAVGWAVRPARRGHRFDVLDADGRAAASEPTYRDALRAAVALMMQARP